MITDDQSVVFHLSQVSTNAWSVYNQSMPINTSPLLNMNLKCQGNRLLSNWHVSSTSTTCPISSAPMHNFAAKSAAVKFAWAPWSIKDIAIWSRLVPYPQQHLSALLHGSLATKSGASAISLYKWIISFIHKSCSYSIYFPIRIPFGSFMFTKILLGGHLSA